MDKDAIRFLAEIAVRRRISRSMNVKPEYNSGMLRGNALYGDNGAPTPKSGKKAKLTLALPRGKADIEAQARRAARQADRLTGPFPWRIDEATRKQCAALPKDDVISDDAPMRNSIQKFTRELRLDGGEKFSLPNWQQATERADLLIAPKTVKPRPDRQNRPKREVQIVKKRIFVLQK